MPGRVLLGSACPCWETVDERADLPAVVWIKSKEQRGSATIVSDREEILREVSGIVGVRELALLTEDRAVAETPSAG